MKVLWPALFSVAFALLAACGDEESAAPLFKLYEPAEGTPERVAYDADLIRYLGTAPPAITRVRSDGDITYTFDIEDGPMCMRGLPYRMSVREQESDELLIFLQGGGACWSDFCLAVTVAPEGIPTAGALDPAKPENPFADFDIAYLPYCDGSLFAGDRDVPEDDPVKLERGLTTRYYRGLANLSAGLTMSHVHFPNPSRVVLAGSSAGGFGTILATAIVRYIYPGVPIDVVNDAGIGIAKAGEPEFVEKLMMEFGAESHVPADCDGCIGDGHITGFIDYFLAKDQNLRVAIISSWFDYVFSEVFLAIGPLAFKDSVEVETGALHEAFPERYRRFIYDGSGHTALLGDVSGIVGSDIINGVELPSSEGLDFSSILPLPTLTTAVVGDVTLSEWLFAMMDGDDEGWVDLTAEPTPPAE
jgi:hypothetical protein